MSQGVIPKSPRSYQRAEGSPVARSVVTGDPSLRLKNGCAQDDAIDERRCHQKFKMSHYLSLQALRVVHAEGTLPLALLGFAGRTKASAPTQSGIDGWTNFAGLFKVDGSEHAFGKFFCTIQR